MCRFTHEYDEYRVGGAAAVVAAAAVVVVAYGLMNTKGDARIH